MTRRPVHKLAAVVLGVLVLSGCEFTGINSVPLPFTQGRGADAYTVTVLMENVVNLVPNSEVKVGDVTVGAVRSIEFADWNAKIVVGLNHGVELPANAESRIGQKSLLGAEYLELAPPAGEPPVGRLAEGAVIGLDRSGRYPETEEVLSALALMLNGGGLDQLRTINRELANTLGSGREEDVRSLLANLDTFVGGLDGQRADLVGLVENLDRFSATAAAQNQVLDDALAALPGGLEALNRQRDDLVRTFEAIDRFGAAATRVLDGSEDELLSNLRSLQPVLSRVADAGSELPEAFGGITFPFPIDAVKRATVGDYMNLFATFDLTTPILTRNFGTGTPIEGVLAGGPLGGPLTGPGTQAGDPLRVPSERLPGLPGPAEIPVPALPIPAPASGEPQPGTQPESEHNGVLLGPLLGGDR